MRAKEREQKGTTNSEPNHFLFLKGKCKVSSDPIDCVACRTINGPSLVGLLIKIKIEKHSEIKPTLTINENTEYNEPT